MLQHTPRLGRGGCVALAPPPPLPIPPRRTDGREWRRAIPVAVASGICLAGAAAVTRRRSAWTAGGVRMHPPVRGSTQTWLTGARALAAVALYSIPAAPVWSWERAMTRKCMDRALPRSGRNCHAPPPFSAVHVAGVTSHPSGDLPPTPVHARAAAASGQRSAETAVPPPPNGHGGLWGHRPRRDTPRLPRNCHQGRPPRQSRHASLGRRSRAAPWRFPGRGPVPAPHRCGHETGRSAGPANQATDERHLLRH